MFQALSIGIALASALLVPLAASAVPIKGADGVPDAAAAASGPRRPGLITPAASNGDAASQTINRRGRPVSGQANNALSSPAEQRSNVAENENGRAPSQL